jgi:hypothetical protein
MLYIVCRLSKSIFFEQNALYSLPLEEYILREEYALYSLPPLEEYILREECFI